MKKTTTFIFCLLALLMTSCLTTRTNVRDYQAVEGKEYKFAKGKQCYLFWGLIPLGRTNVDTPSDGVCQIRTSYRFIDAFVSVITAGIFQMQTIKVMAKRPDNVTVPTPEVQQAPPTTSASQPALQPTPQPVEQPAQPAVQPASQPAAQPAPLPAAIVPAPETNNKDIAPETKQIIFNQADVNKNGIIDESEQAAYNRMLERARKQQ